MLSFKLTYYSLIPCSLPAPYPNSFIIPHTLSLHNPSYTFPLVAEKQNTINLLLLIKKTHPLAEMESDPSYDHDEETPSDSPTEVHALRRPHKGGKHIREEPTTLAELQACPLAITYFQHQSCHEFYELAARIQFHHELAHLFVLHLHDCQASLAGVTFTLTPESISLATGIPNIGEQWNKRQQIDRKHYEPYIKPGYLRKLSKVFPFRYLKDSYAPLMKLIMKYFSCERRFSCLYAYHIKLLMHFTMVRMMNLPYSMC